jgi:hypothetical protein
VRADVYRAAPGSCDGAGYPSAKPTEPVRFAECRAHGLTFSCERSNVLPEPVTRSLRRHGESRAAPARLEVGAFGGSGLVPAQAVRLELRTGSDARFVYVTEDGEVVRLFDDRVGLWWTEGDEVPIPIDVQSVQSAGPSPG